MIYSQGIGDVWAGPKVDVATVDNARALFQYQKIEKERKKREEEEDEEKEEEEEEEEEKIGMALEK